RMRLCRSPPSCRPRLLLLWLLGVCASLSPAGAPAGEELRCRCVQTLTEMIQLNLLAQVELILEGPACAQPEVIATLKNGEELCLNPEAPWVKLIVTKIRSRYLPHGVARRSPRESDKVSPRKIWHKIT
uniref:C-X-C motif chemokine n=1 Tax=Sphenodon punctatus TaxID=8508 RepID=A0A8D0GTQ9_SPHPU